MTIEDKIIDFANKAIDKGIELFCEGVDIVEYLIGRVFITMVAIFILLAILTNWRFFIP
jgi:hypothetical protein